MVSFKETISCINFISSEVGVTILLLKISHENVLNIRFRHLNKLLEMTKSFEQAP